MSKSTDQPMTPSWGLLAQSLAMAQKYITPVAVLVILPSLLLSLSGLKLGGTQVLLGLAGYILMLVNFAPQYFFVAKTAKGNAPTLGESYSQGLRSFWRILGFGIGASVAIGLGFVLLFIPGFVVIYFLIKRYFFVPYYIVDHGLGISDAMEASKEKSAPYTSYIWGVIGVQLALTVPAIILGYIVPLVGAVASLAATFALTFLTALRYAEVDKAGPVAQTGSHAPKPLTPNAA